MYQFPMEARQALEAIPLPLAYFQNTEAGVAAILVSDGLCRMMGAERDALIGQLNRSPFDSIHPDDVGRVSRILWEFSDRLCGYDVIYRGKCGQGGEYHYIHSVGRFQSEPDGTELMIIVYTDISESQSESNLLVENYALFQKDRFYNDSVTGLPNLNYLHEYADEKLSRIHQAGKEAALVYFDVKGLLSYNNQYGYERGNELLCLVADVLKNEFPGALVARGAEDHFIVITDYRDREGLAARIESSHGKVRSGAFGNALGLQAGICLCGNDTSSAVAIEYARHAHKQLGNDLNRIYAVYTSETGAKYWNQRYILETFDTAIRQEWIKIYYQAIMRVKTGKVAALEGLARWVDPARGIISPAEFIPVLEKYHLLHRLDLYMVEQFIKEYPIRIEAGLPIVPVSINFSAQDFDHADIVGALNGMFERSGVSKDDIIIEITEQDMATGTDHFRRQLRDLRAHGFRLWLDDFGSGYSSLNMLSQYDVDVLKIDLEFMRRLDEHNGANRHIVKSIVDIAQKLGVRTLAEGMETEAHLKFLREVGCEFAQGYYFNMPESLASILYRTTHGNPVSNCETPEERKQQNQEWQALSRRVSAIL